MQNPTPPVLPKKKLSRLYFYLAALLVIMFLLLVNSGVSRGIEQVKRAKSAVMLSNLASVSQMYESTYNYWPTHTPAAPTGDYVVRLKNAPWFAPLMMGNPSPADASWNKYKIAFANFQESDLSADAHPVDAYGNDDIVLIFDADHDGKIAPFTETVTGKNGKSFTIRQMTPITGNVVAMSAGKAESDADVITTWTR